MAVEDMKKGNEPFDKADLAEIMLKAIPSSWVNQYNLNHSTLRKSPRQLHPDMENIKCVMNEKRAESVKARAKDSTTLAGAKSRPEKRVSTERESLHRKVLPALQEQWWALPVPQHHRMLQVPQGWEGCCSLHQEAL